MVYLVGTKYLVLRLKMEHLNVSKYNINASYSIHHDMKGHTRESLSMEVGTLHTKSIKKK